MMHHEGVQPDFTHEMDFTRLAGVGHGRPSRQHAPAATHTLLFQQKAHGCRCRGKLRGRLGVLRKMSPTGRDNGARPPGGAGNGAKESKHACIHHHIISQRYPSPQKDQRVHSYSRGNSDSGAWSSNSTRGHSLPLHSSPGVCLVMMMMTLCLEKCTSSPIYSGRGSERITESSHGKAWRNTEKQSSPFWHGYLSRSSVRAIHRPPSSPSWGSNVRKQPKIVQSYNNNQVISRRARLVSSTARQKAWGSPKPTQCPTLLPLPVRSPCRTLRRDGGSGRQEC